MPKRSFAFEPGGEKRLDVSWRGRWRDVTVSLDGNSIGVIPNQKVLSAGQEFSLTDGSILKVQLIKSLDTNELRVLRNEQPLPRSVSDPQTKLNDAYKAVYFVAGLNIVLGLISFLFNPDFLQQFGFSWGSILFGLVSLPLGLFVQRTSTFALILAISIVIIDGSVAFYLAILQGYEISPIGIILVRYFFLTSMFQGLGAIKALKSKSV